MFDLNYSNAKILIVDDQESNVEVLMDFLEIKDYTDVKFTTDPREVIPLIESYNPDIVLLDLMMPYLSGFEIMDLLKSKLSKDTFLPILVLTADATDETKQKALSGGATDFLTKPFDLIEVGLRIQNLLRSKFMFQQLQNQNHILDEKVKERTLELEKAKEKAEAGDRMKTAFLNNISHEIRTPLNGILGFSQVLAEHEGTKEERELYIKQIFASSNRLINTVTSFVDISMLISKNQNVIKKEFDPNELLHLVSEEFKPVCEAKNIKLNINESEHIMLNTDWELMRKTLYHLIDNAVKFTQTGSINLGYLVVENDCRFYVRDTGIGIDKEKQVEIFDVFSQENSGNTRGYEGNGLGLSIVNGIVELLDGKIVLESEKGIGTNVRVTIPGVTKIIHSTANSLANEENGNLRHTILVVEDENLNFLFLKHLLTQDNIELIHAKNGFEAVQFTLQHQEINLVLMDLKMPEMDGFEATRQIKEIRQSLPVIAVTAYSGIDDEIKAKKAGCDEIVLKPINHLLLAKVLEKYSVQLNAKSN